MPLMDIGDCEPLYIQDVTSPGLMLPIKPKDDAEAFLFLQEGEGISAVFLSGQWAFHSDVVSKLSGRQGLFIPGVSIRVDTDSILPEVSHSGAVVRSPGVYGVRARRESGNGFTQNVTVPIAGGVPQYQQDALRVSFTRWQIGRTIDGEWVNLWTVDAAPASAE